MVAADGGVKLRTGVPARPSRSNPETAWIGFCELPSPATWNGVVRVGDERGRGEAGRDADEPGRPGVVGGAGLAADRAADGAVDVGRGGPAAAGAAGRAVPGDAPGRVDRAAGHLGPDHLVCTALSAGGDRSRPSGR